MERMNFWVVGTPAPQGSKSVSRTGHMYEASKKVKPWRAAVQARAEAEIRGTEWVTAAGPVHVEVLFFLERPKSHYRQGAFSDVLKQTAPEYPTYKPDCDKLQRSTLDALTSARVYVDDSQVVLVHAEKAWAIRGATAAGVQITVTTLDPES